VIKVCGWTLEATEVADRINPNGSGERKEKEAPVSKTIGNVEVGSKFGWRGGTKSEVAVVAEATTVGTVAVEATGVGAATVAEEATVAVESAEVAVEVSPMRVIVVDR